MLFQVTYSSRILAVARRKRWQSSGANALPKLKLVVKEIVDEMRQMPDRGEVASYIPELARVDPKSFGLVVIDADGNAAASGDADEPFSIQSIS